jgi:hypothetical protein
MSGAHIAIAARRRRQRQHQAQEEETMNHLNTRGLDDQWEFKIIRATTGIFKNRANLAAILEEEALAGWELVELFDNHRIRLKRPTSQRRKDIQLPAGMDPYRTQVGITEGVLAVGITAAVLAVGLGVAILFLV